MFLDQGGWVLLKGGNPSMSSLKSSCALMALFLIMPSVIQGASDEEGQHRCGGCQSCHPSPRGRSPSSCLSLELDLSQQPLLHPIPIERRWCFFAQLIDERP